MSHPFALTQENRATLARAFQANRRVDLSVDCVVEGRMGKAFVDDPGRPAAFRITTGPFWYFAGEARGSGAHSMMEEFPADGLLMPSSDAWMETARETFAGRLQPMERYGFSSAKLSADHLERLGNGSGYRDRIAPIDRQTAADLRTKPLSYLEISEFPSVEDFINQGLGFAARDRGTVIGAAYSSLVCSKGIEVSLFVEERYRQKGVGTALASRLLLECLRRGWDPHWDAANPESYKLAKKLGYTFDGAYDAWYRTS